MVPAERHKHQVFPRTVRIGFDKNEAATPTEQLHGRSTIIAENEVIRRRAEQPADYLQSPTIVIRATEAVKF